MSFAPDLARVLRILNLFMSGVVAIVGRPNVGKSTLFNRLIGKRQAIESDIPGTTRDRLYHTTRFGDYEVLLVDTGGLELGRTGGTIEENVQEQSRIAIEGADVILFVVDVRTDLTSEDFHAAELLRKSKKEVLLIANKCDNSSLEDNRFHLYELGFGEPIPVSAIHSDGLDLVSHATAKALKGLGMAPAQERFEDEDAEKRIRIAFLGRPNVGKSTMVNGLFGKKMVVVSEIAGTTRDSTEIPFSYKEYPFTLIDTAGIRKRGKVEKGLEKYSVLRSMQAVNEADVCVLLLDAEGGLASQDLHISEYILEERKGLILVVNKMDIEKGKAREALENLYINRLRAKMAYVPWAPVVFASGLERKNIFRILDLAVEIAEERSRTLEQEDLNVWLAQTLAKHPPRGKRGKNRFDIMGVEQTGTEPPQFTFTCFWPELMHFSYRRFLENALREQFGFAGSAVQLAFKRPNERNAEKHLIREGSERV